jgi:hypothetical protein
VTNDDLKKGQRQPSVSIPPSQASKEDTSEKVNKPQAESSSIEPDSPENIEKDDSTHLDKLEQKYEKAKNEVEILTAKMNGLFMKYYSVDNKTPKEMIQSEISRTNLQLQKARDDEEKAKKELEEYKSENRK